MKVITDSLHAVQRRISDAEVAFGRPRGSVRLLAVSKTQPPEAIEQAYRAGQHAFGESYVQEALKKIAAFSYVDMEWHFIGPIQANKTRSVAQHFHWVHSVDRLKVARRLSEQRPGDLPPLQTCLQVNISREPSKAGVAPGQAAELARAIAGLPNLRLRGLMAIPAYCEGLEPQRIPFRQLRELWEQMRAEGLPLDTLSMGMSADLEAAIAEGATMVRIGTAIFGPRKQAGDRAFPKS